MKRWYAVIVMSLGIICLTAMASHAGKKKIWPDQLLPESSNEVYTQNTFEIFPALSSGDAYFYARVKLPLGKKVTKLTYHYPNYASTTSRVYLMRSNMLDYQETMAVAYSANTGTGGRLAAEDDTINFAKIKSGYTYWVRAYCENPNGRIRGIIITYK